MASSGIEPPRWRLSHSVKKLRLLRGWSIDECAYHASLRPADIRSLETAEPCTPKILHDRLLQLENAFGIDLINEFVTPPGQSGFTAENSLILPFVSRKISVHQNSMEWSRSGILQGVMEHAPHLGILPKNMIKRFIGRKVPPGFVDVLKQKTRFRFANSIRSPYAWFSHYKRLIEASARSEWTAPFRYEAKLIGSETNVTREVTCVKLSANAYETQTRVISKNKLIERAFVDVACCKDFDDCSKCYLQVAKSAIGLTG